MVYGVNSVRPLDPLRTVTFVTYIYVKSVLGNISQISWKNTKCCHFKRRDQLLKDTIHSSKICELYCEQCDIRVCATYVSAKEYQDHKFIEMIKQMTTAKIYYKTIYRFREIHFTLIHIFSQRLKVIQIIKSTFFIVWKSMYYWKEMFAISKA